jgi:hypothetical protein
MAVRYIFEQCLSSAEDRGRYDYPEFIDQTRITWAMFSFP